MTYFDKMEWQTYQKTNTMTDMPLNTIRVWGIESCFKVVLTLRGSPPRLSIQQLSPKSGVALAHRRMWVKFLNLETRILWSLPCQIFLLMKRIKKVFPSQKKTTSSTTQAFPNSQSGMQERKIWGRRESQASWKRRSENKNPKTSRVFFIWILPFWNSTELKLCKKCSLILFPYLTASLVWSNLGSWPKKVYFISLGELKKDFRSVLQITKISNNDFMSDAHVNNPVTLFYLLLKK